MVHATSQTEIGPPTSSVPPSRGCQHDLTARSRRQRRLRDSHLASHIYTHSHLIFFSLLGTLARLGLQALTYYPGAPVTFPVLWANVTGCFAMGALVEDRSFFHYPLALRSQELASAAARKAHMAAKKTIPLYIGLTVGFCGSCTSFSTVMRDMFLSASNDMPQTPPFVAMAPPHRNGGHSFLAVLAVLVTNVTLSYAAFIVGAHFAAALPRLVVPSLRFDLMRNCLDPLAVILGWGCWVGAVLLAVFPPHDRWRGDVLFALVFAPLGCLLRFHLAVQLNMRVPTFPVGTLAANVLGTVVLGMVYDLIYAPVGGVLGCQVLRGIDDGFCGCLTTVSTWIAEMNAVRGKRAVTYGVVSVSAAFSFLIIIMGGMRWGHGFATPLC
ncbi:hypothetical protein ACRALDRAFT_2094483 [Sodiomyces alcalophilus JCM 7366]|uniref:uncharacterized protein n=1 Tax=Sodiomyces alcalophilus JCM 7366 TaxID=591952 RepID=UPI0039B68DA2